MIATTDIYWAAGFLDGEGAFIKPERYARGRSGLVVSASQSGRELLERLQRLFGGSISLAFKAGQHTHKRDHFHWRIRGMHGAALMMTLYPLLSSRRREQIRSALAIWRTQRVANRDRTGCRQGHPYDARERNGGRVCTVCRTARRRKRYQLLGK